MSASRPLSPYYARIQALAPGYDPCHIEGYMRLGHSTLDQLDPEDFVLEVEIARACVDEGGLEIAERNAQSMGLKEPDPAPKVSSSSPSP